MSRIINSIKQSIYYRANLLFPTFFKKRFFAGLHSGLTNAAGTEQLPEKELLILYYLLPENGVAVDVGANNGAYSYFFKEIVKCSRVLAFEPLPGLFKKLETWFDNLELFNLALSNETGTATIRVPVINDRLYESRAKLDDLKEEHQTATKELKIQTEKLDKVVTQAKLDRLDVIKIDIEGHELKAIDGAIRSIGKFKPYLLVEIESRHHGGSITGPVEQICAMGYDAWFFHFSNKRLETFANYDLKEMQNPQRQNTFSYINNFLFVPKEKPGEVTRVNEWLADFFNGNHPIK